MAPKIHVSFSDFLSTINKDNPTVWSDGRIYTDMLSYAAHNRLITKNMSDADAMIFENVARGGLTGLINDELEHSTWALEELKNLPDLHPYRREFPFVSFYLANRWADMVNDVTWVMPTAETFNHLMEQTPGFIKGSFILFMASKDDKKRYVFDHDSEKFQISGISDVRLARAIREAVAAEIDFDAMPGHLPQYQPTFGAHAKQA